MNIASCKYEHVSGKVAFPTEKTSLSERKFQIMVNADNVVAKIC